MRILILSAFILMLCSCKKSNENNCNQTFYSPGNLISVQGAATGVVNTDYPFIIKYSLDGGCKSFSHLEDLKVGNTVQINTIIGSTGCTCTAIYSEQNVDYNFRASVAGTYTLNFQSGEAGVISKTIVIN